MPPLNMGRESSAVSSFLGGEQADPSSVSEFHGWRPGQGRNFHGDLMRWIRSSRSLWLKPSSGFMEAGCLNSLLVARQAQAPQGPVLLVLGGSGGGRLGTVGREGDTGGAEDRADIAVDGRAHGDRAAVLFDVAVWVSRRPGFRGPRRKPNCSRRARCARHCLAHLLSHMMRQEVPR